MRENMKIEKVVVYDINWDTDGEKVDYLPNSVMILHAVDDDDIADYLSDRFGFCIFDFKIRRER